MKETGFPLPKRHQLRLTEGAPREMNSDAVTKAFLWINGYGRFPLPVSVALNLTNRCMGRCVHCSQWTWPHRPEFTEYQLEKLFETLHKWKLKAITLGGGNPLLHEHLALALDLASHYDMEVGIISEGARMTGAVSTAICKQASWIRFSLDGPNPTVHYGIRNTQGLFELVMACIKSLQQDRSQLQIGLNCVLQKRNLKSIPQMMAVSEEIGVDYISFKIPHGEDISGSYLPSIEEWDGFWQWAKQHLRTKTRVKSNLDELVSLLDLGIGTEDMAVGKPVRKL